MLAVSSLMHALVDALLSNLEAKRAAYAHMHDGSGTSSSGGSRVVEAIRNARTHLFVCNNCHYLHALLNECVASWLPPPVASGIGTVVATRDMFLASERLVEVIDAGSIMASVVNR